MMDARVLASRLHRDVSVGNILIYTPDPTDPESLPIGLLCDWELAKTKDQLEKSIDPALTWRSVSGHSSVYSSDA